MVTAEYLLNRARCSEKTKDRIRRAVAMKAEGARLVDIARVLVCSPTYVARLLKLQHYTRLDQPQELSAPDPAATRGPSNYLLSRRATNNESEAMNLAQIEEILKGWTPEYMDAAQREGWDLFTTTSEDGEPVQVQRIDDPEELPSGLATHLPNDDAAMAIVFAGTGAHHLAARAIIKEYFPKEWANVQKVGAMMGDQLLEEEGE